MADHPQIKQVINTLKNDFTLSGNPNSRKGGLVGLAASAIALGRVCCSVLLIHHTHTHTHMHICTCMLMHAGTHTTHKNMHTYTREHTHSNTQAHGMHAHTHTHNT